MHKDMLNSSSKIFALGLSGENICWVVIQKFYLLFFFFYKDIVMSTCFCINSNKNPDKDVVWDNKKTHENMKFMQKIFLQIINVWSLFSDFFIDVIPPSPTHAY